MQYHRKTTIHLFIMLLSLFYYTCNDPSPVSALSAILIPTNQEFSFARYEIPDVEGSITDMAVIDEKNIWLIGNFYLPDTIDDGIDSSGVPYTLLRWNEGKWKYTRLHYWYAEKAKFECIYPNEIFTAKSGEIFFGDGLIYKYNTSVGRAELIADYVSEFSIHKYVNKFWAASSNNIWGVGSNGSIIYYDGIIWREIEGYLGSYPSCITGYSDIYNSVSHIYVTCGGW